MLINSYAISQSLSPSGLLVRGSLNEGVIELPPIDERRAAKSLLLVGTAGSSFWTGFCATPEYLDRIPNPLDRWSRRMGDGLAGKFNGRAIYPFDGPPYHPFLRWAQHAEPLQVSKLGLSIHPAYGLWHTYRFAVLLPHEITTSMHAEVDTNICNACTDQPCLQSCPVDAFSNNHYDVDACIGYLKSDASSDCHTLGCVARRSCPVGAAYSYEKEHAAFHMAAFYGSKSRN